MPKIHLVEPEATYLMWLDCSGLGISGDELADFIIRDCQVAVSRGDGFGQEGKNFIRLNIGCPTSTLKWDWTASMSSTKRDLYKLL